MVSVTSAEFAVAQEDLGVKRVGAAWTLANGTKPIAKTATALGIVSNANSGRPFRRSILHAADFVSEERPQNGYLALSLIRQATEVTRGAPCVTRRSLVAERVAIEPYSDIFPSPSSRRFAGCKPLSRRGREVR